VLAVFGGKPAAWWHGYDIAKRTGLKSGTLYPILIRLADRGLVEARWEDEQPAGRPRRHLYRLTADGRAAARSAAVHATAPAAPAPAASAPAGLAGSAGADGRRAAPMRRPGPALGGAR
jgi:DNA-binding MarR family transcriptional regulator